MPSRRTVLRGLTGTVPLALAGCAALESGGPGPAVTDLRIEQTGETGAWSVEQVQPVTDAHPAVIEVRFENTGETRRVLGEGMYHPFTTVLEAGATPEDPPAPLVLNPWNDGAWENEATTDLGVWQTAYVPGVMMVATVTELAPGEATSRRYQLLSHSSRGLSPEPGPHTFRNRFTFGSHNSKTQERATLTVETR